MLGTMLLSEDINLGQDSMVAVAEIVHDDDVVSCFQKLKRGM